MTRNRRTPILCPTCTKPLSRVVESIPWQGGIRRRRVCPDGHAAITREVLVKAA